MTAPNTDLLALAEKTDRASSSWIPISGHVVNITYTFSERARVVTALRTAAAHEAEIARLREALLEMIQTQRDWEDAVGKIIGHPPNVFVRAIDRAEAALATTESK